MNITLQYGKKGLAIHLPDDWDVTVIRKKPMAVLPDPQAALERALAHPVASGSLFEAAKGSASACILICDITRPVPNGLVLRELIRQMLSSGMGAGRIKILVATGLHRPNEGVELEELVGDDRVLKTIAVENHFARRNEDHVDLGRTRRGTPIKLDRRFVDADLRIVTGLVEPHFMAGYSGGRKVIVPGIAHEDTIRRLHTASFLEDPRATNCTMDGNPFHEEMLEMLDFLGPVLAVNTVLDEERRLSFVNFGEIRATHRDAVSFVRPHVEVQIPRRFRTIITTSAGHPLDKTYYQTIKGMVGAMDALEPGGRLFVASECSEGFGSREYVEAQRRLVHLGPEGFLQDIGGKLRAEIDEWQTEMQLRTMRRGSVSLFCNLRSQEDRTLTAVDLVDSFERAVIEWVEKIRDRRVAIIPEGPYVIPFCRSDES